MKSDQMSTEADVLQALRIYLFFRVLETCLDVLPKLLWSRIAQFCYRCLNGNGCYRFLSHDEKWNRNHSTSEKSSALEKARAVDKFITEAIFGIVPIIIDLLLAVCFAANRLEFGVQFKSR